LEHEASEGIEAEALQDGEGADSFSDYTIVTLTGLSRLGSCQASAPGSDRLSGCIR
jgi:hypothetical protein